MRTFLLAVMTLLSLSSSAATHYIRDGGTASTAGTGSCTGWATANACDVLPATLIRGDTYYIADGTYAGRTFSTANSGTTLITIKKAVAADHGTDTDWVSTYGDGQAVFGDLIIYTDYYLFDGQVRNANWRTGGVDQYGLSVGNTRFDNGGGTGGDNLTFRYVDIHGGGRDTGAGDDVIYDLVGGINITFQYCALRDSDRTIFLTRGTPTNWLIEYSYIARNASSPAIHGEIHSSTASSNFTWRYNVIEDPEGTAVWAFINGGTANNWFIYGNVIFHSASYNREGISGVLYVANDASNNNTLNGLRFYNNTIHGIDGLWSGVVIQSGTNNLVYNNIWSQSTTTNNSGGTYNYNTYYQTNSDGGAQSQTVGTQPLISPSTGNFGLAAATTAGTNVGSPYDIDPLGVTRGADGVWDRGAFEYVSGGGGDTTPPTTPTSPSATAAGATQINLSWTASTDNVAIGGYTIRWCAGAACTPSTTIDSPGLGTTYSHTGRTASTLYRYTIQAYDTASPTPNTSSQTSIVQATTSAPATFAVTPSEAIGATHGTITPSTPQSITEGTTTQFAVTPDAGYQAFVDGTCGGSLVSTTYTTNVITGACSVQANFIPSVCVVPQVNVAGNTAMTTQTGTFTYLFSVLPAVATHDIVLGHTNGAWAGYNSTATAVRFFTNGRIDAINGASYLADVVYTYSAGTKYDVRMVVNIAAHTYSVWVAPEGGAETQIANNFAFRTTQASATQLNNFAYYVDIGTPGGAYVCPVGITGGDTTSPTVQARRIAASGNSFELDLDEPAGSVSGSAGLTLSATGGAVTLAGCSTAADIITCSTSRQILGAETVTASYSGAGGIADTTGNPLASFSTQAVTNNSAQVLVALSLLTPPDGTQYRKEVSSTTIGLTTSKSASCRRASSTGIVWASMTPYTTTGATSHSANFPVVAGGGYRVCSRCLDTAAQQYSTDACTHFSVRSARKR